LTVVVEANIARGQSPQWVHEVALATVAAIKVVTAACAVEGALHPRQRRYRGKAMRIRAVGYAAGLGLVPAVWLSQSHHRPYPAGADLAVSVPLMIDAVGNTIGVYDDARLDDLVHGVNAGVLSALFGAVISPHVRSRTTATVATIAFGAVGELLWEVMEYIGQALGFKGMMLSKDDTASDIAAAFAGTAVAAAITWIRWRPSADRPLVDWGKPAESIVEPGQVAEPDLSAVEEAVGAVESKADEQGA
jgi:hypothetical protein